MIKPSQIIYRADGTPYMLRWYLIYRSWLRLYVHKFIADDEREALHDHPRASWSLLFRGKYVEVTPRGRRIYWAPAIIHRSAEHLHRIELIDNLPAWTLFLFFGHKKRDWGFWCPSGWKHWREYHTNIEKGGEGCGEVH